MTTATQAPATTAKGHIDPAASLTRFIPVQTRSERTTSFDPADSLQASLDVAERVPGAELVRLDVDHLPQYRDPAAVADVVRRTVARAD